MDLHKQKEILRDVLSGTSVKESTVKYDGHALAEREKIKSNVDKIDGVVMIPNEWPEFSDEEWAEIMSNRESNE